MTVDDTTRTPDPNDADAAAAASEPAAKDERTDDYQKRQALEHKVKAEKLNALLELHGVSTVEELNERLSQPPASRVDAGSAPDEREARRRKVKEFADAGDPLAQENMELREMIYELAQGVGTKFVENEVEDPTLRKRARDHYERNKHRLDFKGALAEVRNQDLNAEVETLRAKLAKQSTAMPDPDAAKAPPTQGRELSASETQARKMTKAKYDHDKATLPMRDSLALQRAYNEGKITFSG